MIIAAALCPWAPLLARELTGRDPILQDLRKACAEATERLAEARPELVAVVGPGTATQGWDPDSHLDLSVFAPALGTSGHPALPPSLGLGALLLDQAGYEGHRILQAVSEDEPAASCAELGAAISSPRSGWACWPWAMAAPGAADGPPVTSTNGRRSSTPKPSRRCAKATLAHCSRSAPLSPESSWLPAGPAWQVLAGAMLPATPAADILYTDDPFGVAYLVAFIGLRALRRGVHVTR